MTRNFCVLVDFRKLRLRLVDLPEGIEYALFWVTSFKLLNVDLTLPLVSYRFHSTSYTHLNNANEYLQQLMTPLFLAALFKPLFNTLLASI